MKKQIAVSFDTTGSMYPAITQVRRKAEEMVRRLIRDLHDVEIALIAHGDYEDRPYEVMMQGFTSDVSRLVSFINTADVTNGFGNGGECYELVMYRARTELRWDSNAVKALVMIGDEPPHIPSFYQNRMRLDWQQELQYLRSADIRVYGVQALNRYNATHFWQALGGVTGGFHLTLDQFHEVTDLLMAIAYKTDSDDRLLAFEREVEAASRMSRSNERMFNTLLRRTEITPSRTHTLSGRVQPVQPTSRYGNADALQAVPPGRFQMLEVDHDVSISDFCRSALGTFNIGLGFYEMTKTETIQPKKEVVLMDRRSGDMFTGNKAREILGLPQGLTVRHKVPKDVLDKYVIFVQSTSSNRKLIGGTRFLYEVHDYASVGSPVRV